MTIGKDPQLEAAADATLERLAANWQSGLDSVAVSSIFTLGPDYATQNYHALSDQIDKLQGTFRTWAENGQRDNGTAFSWERWNDFADMVGKSIEDQRGIAWDGSQLGAVLGAASSTLDTVTAPVRAVAAVFDPDAPAVPARWKRMALYVGVGLVALYLLNTAVREATHSVVGKVVDKVA